MFSKGSRYINLTDTSTVENGQAVGSKTLRWIPQTSGTFLHTVNQTDRLDLLAYKYYGDSKKWWLICDANPEFALPTDLLDLSPYIREIFTLEPPAGDNQWAILMSELKLLNGIQKVHLDVFKNTVELIYNEKELGQEKIMAIIKSKGFANKSIIRQERIGQRIIVPQNQIV